MTDSKAPRLAWGTALALMVAAGFTLAACSGGDDGLSQAQEEALQELLDAAEDERDDAEDERDDAIKERDDARSDLREEQQENQGLQEERDAAEDERDEAQQTLDRFVAFEIVTQIPPSISRTSVTSIVPTVTGPLSYNEPVLATAPGATFTSTSTGSSGGWFKTTRSGISEQRKDFVEIFSNVEAPFREDFRDHSLGSGLTYNDSGRPIPPTQHIDITTGTHGTIAASSRFPRPSTQRQGELETFTVVDRGQFDADRRGDADYTEDDGATNPTYRSFTRYPERYSVDISGALMGALGTFRCAGDTAGESCTVDLSGPNDYVFASDTNVEWQFIPTSATSQVIIPDAEYFWFGWWMREPFETTPNAVNAVFDYAANYGGTNPVTNVADATGSATYEGAAIGYYGVYDIEAAEDDRSRAGRFQAKATLIADFDAVDEGTLRGSITEFDTEPTWEVTLKSQAISTGAVAAAADTVSWTISGLPRDGGQWEAQFYSNFEDPAETAQPTGVAGAFTAQYGAHRKMVGAFGAERD